MKKYCVYIFRKGVRKGNKCNEKVLSDTSFCRNHQKKDDKPKKIEDELPKTIIHVNKLVTKKIQEDLLKEKILKLDTLDENKSVIMKHYNNMKKTDVNSTEYYKNQLFVDCSLNYPWNVFYNINDIAKQVGIVKFLNYIKIRLDEEIYGMTSVKNEILNVVCKFISNPSSNRNNIALYGPAGVAKSRFIKVLSEILGIPLKTISLGGIKDSSFFLGHGYVYVESGPGKILQNIIDAKISNPIMYFDELDKVSETDNGKDIYSFLCYLTDPTQNTEFSDHYFYGMKFDLSKIFYVFTFNDINKIDKILLDRLNIIQVPVPSDSDILCILQDHCIPEIVKNIGIKSKISIENTELKYILTFCKVDKRVTSGIRQYYRIIEKILLELNKDILLENFQIDNENFTLDKNLFMKFFDNIRNQLINDEQQEYPHFYI